MAHMNYEVDDLALSLLRRIRSYQDKGQLETTFGARIQDISEEENINRRKMLFVSYSRHVSNEYRDWFASGIEAYTPGAKNIQVNDIITVGPTPWPHESIMYSDWKGSPMNPAHYLVPVRELIVEPKRFPFPMPATSVQKRLLDCFRVNPYETTKLFCEIGIAILAFNLLLYFLVHALIINPVVSILGIPACCLYWLMAQISKRLQKT